MKIILPPFVLTLTFFCCTQASNVDKKNLHNSCDSTKGKDLYEGKTNSLTIFKTHYVLSLQGQKLEIKTQEQLSEILKKNYNRQDSLYILIGDVSGDQVENVMESIHSSKVDRYKVIVKNKFFKLPYPN